MNLTIHHRNVSLNIVIASVIARKLYELEKTLGITDATVTLKSDQDGSLSILVRAEMEPSGFRIKAEGADPQPGTALIKVMADLQKKSQRRLNSKWRIASSGLNTIEVRNHATRRLQNRLKTKLKPSKLRPSAVKLGRLTDGIGAGRRSQLT